MSLREIFYPESVAVIGALSDDQKEKSGWMGRLLEFGYKGKVFPINPKATQILGQKAYANVRDIPEPVDYAIVRIPANFVPGVLLDCFAKELKAVHIFTAGFAEAGTENGNKLQVQLEDVLRKRGNTRVIGPNCMGIYCPASGLTFNIRFAREPGSVGVLSQSGAAMLGLVVEANRKAIRFSKVVSYGNGMDLECGEFLDFFSEDPETKIVCCYVEGPKNGHKFFEAALKCAHNKKPLIILKGGMTAGGMKAAASHTASLAGTTHVWDAFFKQTGAIAVDTFEEMVEQIVAFQHFRPPQGRRVGIVTRGGGPGVVATDQCERAGLSVVPITTETMAKLAKVTPSEAGSSIRNPVEIGLGLDGLSQYYGEGLETVAADPNVDMIITQIMPHLYTQFGVGAKQVEDSIDVLIRTAKRMTKPLVAIMPVGDSLVTIEPVLKAHEKGLSEGLPVFTDITVAIKAISNVIRYYEFTRSLA